MLNGVSDFIDQNRRCSGVRVTVVALSSALDVSGSPCSTAPSHTNAGRCPVSTGLSQGPEHAPTLHMTTQLAGTLQVLMGRN